MVTDRRTGYLEELEHELDTRGLVARVVRTRSGPAFLRVINPEAASLAEDVTCAPAPETHDHYYWWSWGERLHRVDDPGGAALKLAHVLQPLGTEPLHTQPRAAQTRATPSRAAQSLGTQPLDTGVRGPNGPHPGPEGQRARPPQHSAGASHGPP